MGPHAPDRRIANWFRLEQMSTSLLTLLSPFPWERGGGLTNVEPLCDKRDSLIQEGVRK